MPVGVRVPVRVRVSVCVPLAAVQLPPFLHRRQPPTPDRRASSSSKLCLRRSSDTRASIVDRPRIHLQYRRHLNERGALAGPSAPRRWMTGCPIASSMSRALARSSPRLTVMLRLPLPLRCCWPHAALARVGPVAAHVLHHRPVGRASSYGVGLTGSRARAVDSMVQALCTSVSIRRGCCWSRRRRQPKPSGPWKRASAQGRPPLSLVVSMPSP